MNDTENSGQVIYEPTPSARLQSHTRISDGAQIYTTEGAEACITWMSPLGSEFAVSAITLLKLTLASLGRKVGA